MPTLTVAFCTFNRADRLEKLVAALRAQRCPVPFEILAVNNNSPDNTLGVLAHLQCQPGAPLRVVIETAPGIVPARNRALAESLDRDILVFIDDDELPQPGLLDAAYDAIVNEEVECAGVSV
jgi:glycosyltransferase involved in cell wall biosynthesis